jgi:hypothetical protein
VPRVIDELLGRELLVAPPLVEDILILQRWGTRWWRGVQWSIALLSLHLWKPGGGGRVMAREPTKPPVLLLSPQVPETRSASVQVVMAQCIRYAKIILSFKPSPHELAALMLGLTAFPHQLARLAVKGPPAPCWWCLVVASKR